MATVVFPCRSGETLLRRHSLGSDRFAGLWNGLGGHVEPGENICTAAAREVREEAGLDLISLRLRVVLNETGLRSRNYVIFFFSAQAESKLLRPEPGIEIAWHDVNSLHDLPLVSDLPPLLDVIFGEGDPVFATQYYDGKDRSLSLDIRKNDHDEVNREGS